MMETKTRVRKLFASETHWGQRSFVFPSLNVDNYVNCLLQTTQTTVSEGHPYSRLTKNNGEDIGGEFYSSNISYSGNCPYVQLWSGTPNNSNFYFGRIFPKYAQVSPTFLDSAFDLEPSDSSTIDALGSTAISKVIPTNPVSGMGVFLGELREGLPHIIGSDLFRSGKPLKSSGGEYLNWEFGWKPMIADIKKFIHAYRQADKLLDQFKRDSGRRVRRRFSFPRLEVVSASASLAVTPAAVGNLTQTTFWQGGTNKYPLLTEVRTTIDRWFAGAFTYYVEIDDDSHRKWKADLQRLNHLWGVKITPETVWNLTPWSWAADWFANTGNLVHNFVRFSDDGLVMPYGYMMEQSVMKTTYRMTNLKPKGYTIPDLTQVFTKTIKTRRQATPFGFGVDFGSLTQRQQAIIAALGLSRGR